MVKTRWILLTALFSFSAFGVSFQEKKNRVEYLEELAGKDQSMNLDVYRRELQYEKLELPLEKRAQNEANLLAENIKLGIQRAYEAALENKSSEEAVIEISEAIDKDLKLIAPELQDEIRALSMDALASAQTGAINNQQNLALIENVLLKGITERHEFLNREADHELPRAKIFNNKQNSSTSDSEKVHYANKAEILESLISERESTRWVSTSNQNMRSAKLVKAEQNISYRIKAEFLGVALDAGPNVDFRREIETSVYLMADGLNPVLLPDGNFDFFKRDRAGNPIRNRGVNERRFVFFVCESRLNFESEYRGGGGFHVAGLGASVSNTTKFMSSVTLASRRIFVPESINGKSVTLSDLQILCHKDFLSAHITNNMTVEGSLNILMKNVIASLRFSHPKTKCGVDNQCMNWFKNEITSLARVQNFPRCVEDGKEKFQTCELRGLRGQNCSVFDFNGKLISDGKMEYKCDKGLGCVQTELDGLFKSAKGKCMPINNNTYRAPNL